MDWIKTSIIDKAQIIAQLHAIEPVYRFTPENTAIDTLALPFYQNAKLVRVIKTGMPLWYVQTSIELVPIDGSINNIHYIDAQAPLLTDDAAYRHFRAAFSNGTLPARFMPLPPST